MDMVGGLLASTLRTQQPPVTVAQIRAEKQVSTEKNWLVIMMSNFILTYLFFHCYIGIG